MAATPHQPHLDLMKQVNRQFITGVTVVTAMDGEKPRGLAVKVQSHAIAGTNAVTGQCHGRLRRRCIKGGVRDRRQRAADRVSIGMELRDLRESVND